MDMRPYINQTVEIQFKFREKSVIGKIIKDGNGLYFLNNERNGGWYNIVTKFKNEGYAYAFCLNPTNDLSVIKVTEKQKSYELWG